MKTQKETVICSLQEYQNNTMYIDIMRHFINCMDGKENPLISIEDALYTQEVCLRVKNEFKEKINIGIATALPNGNLIGAWIEIESIKTTWLALDLGDY